MSPCQLSPADTLLPAASVIAWTADQPADLEEAVGLTLAALGLSGQQQQAAGSGACVFLFHVSVCQNQRNREMFTREYEVHRVNGLVALTASASTHCPCSRMQASHKTQPSF